MTPFSIDLKRNKGNIVELYVFVATTTTTRASISLFPLVKRELNLIHCFSFSFLFLFFFRNPGKDLQTGGKSFRNGR